MQRRSVLLPDPDGSMMQTTSEGLIEKLMPCNAASEPKCL